MLVTITRDGMSVDRLVWEVLQDASAARVEATLALNPGLAARGVILPVGLRVLLPEGPPAATIVATTRLWD